MLKFISHSETVLSIAVQYGWLPGARYTNLRDVKQRNPVGFIDIDWKDYRYEKHIEAVKKTKPLATIAKDIESLNEIDSIIEQAYELKKYAKVVILVPKAAEIANAMNSIIPMEFLVGYSVPTRYGKTNISPKCFNRPVHLLGGRPDVQRELAEVMNVISIDGNRLTFDAKFGDYFNGTNFTPHPKGGYALCLEESIKNVNALWNNYNVCQDSLNEYYGEFLCHLN